MTISGSAPAETNPNAALAEQMKRFYRAQAEQTKDDFWADLVAKSGGTVSPEICEIFDNYCADVERLVAKLFSELDAIMANTQAVIDINAAIRTALVAGDKVEAARIYYQWSEANFGITGQVAGVQYVDPPSN